MNSILESALTNVPLPDETVKVVGGHVDLTNIVLKNVVFTAQQVGLVPPNQVTIDLNNFSGELDLSWRYKGPLGVHFSGTATNQFSDTAIQTLFTFDANAKGAPAVSLDSLKVQINTLDVHISGVVGWVIDLLVKLFKGLLIDVLQKKIDSVAQTEINAILQKIETSYPLVLPMSGSLLNATQMEIGLVPGGAAADVGVASDATPVPFAVNGAYMVASGEWFFESTLNGTVDPRAHDWIPENMPLNPAGTAPMLGFALSEPLLGTLLWSLTQNGAFDFTLDNSMLNPSSTIRLDTKLFSAEYPLLYARYPDNNMSLAFAQYAEYPPLATTSTEGTTISNLATMMMNVIDPTQPNPIVPVCNVLLNYSVTIDMSLIDNTTSAYYLTGRISPLVFDAEILWAGIDPGQFGNDVAGLIQTVADDLLVPIINGALATGFAIPATIDVVQMKNVFVSYGPSGSGERARTVVTW